MTQSYSQIVRQIETLQRKANAARKKEVAGVVGRIKEAISFYELTANELGLSAGRPSARVRFDQLKNRSVNGGFDRTGARSRQSFVDSVLSW